MRLWIGILTFLLGAALWARSQWSGPAAPWSARLGVGTGALGLSTLAMTQEGLPWIFASIALSIVAIVLIGWVVHDIIRRR